MWVFPPKVQAAFLRSCLLRNLCNGRRGIGFFSPCFPLKLFLWSLHLVPKPQFIFHVIFWVAASCKLCKRRWEGIEGEVTEPKQRENSKPLPLWVVQYAVFVFCFYSNSQLRGFPPHVRICLCHRPSSECICIWEMQLRTVPWLIALMSSALSQNPEFREIREVWERAKLNANGNVTSSARTKIA